MKILLISRPFAPDSVISAIRITKFAKYLKSEGHNVVVITAGRCFGRPSKSNLEGVDSIPLYSYETKRKIAIEDLFAPASKKVTYAKNNRMFVKKIKTFFHYFYDLHTFYNVDGKQIKNKIVDLYDNNEDLRGFDIVLASFSPLGCVQAASYIANKEQARFIIDFRDLMTNTIYTPILRFINRYTQKKYVGLSHSSICVSEGNSYMLKKLTGYENKIFTVNNGFDDLPIECNNGTTGKELTICYTGTLYGGTRDLRPLFKAIKDANREQEVNIRFIYAGKDGNIAKIHAKEYDLEQIVEDRGLVSSEEAQILQMKSDIFLVVSWNTKEDLGILTGKFYEALRSRKPIIAIVSGNVPNSELRNLVVNNNLGVCYEECDESSQKQLLKKYLLEQYEYKLKHNHVLYEPVESVFDEFHYQNIVKKLISIMERG